MSLIFHIDEQKRATPLHEEQYESEDLLQQLIENYPDILAGDQIDPDNPRKWILISREMGVPEKEGGNSRWFLDHLFIDQDGIPTFVEVKRSTDTRTRREVVAQMLDYAANATAYWPAGYLRETYDKTKQQTNASLHDKLGIASENENAFWETVDNNLRHGKLRLLFVADDIPASLRQIIEFLNSQMVDTEVLALEIKQYVSSGLQKTLVPKLIGNTSASIQIKHPTDFMWTEDLFLERVYNVSGIEAQNVCERLLRDFEALGCQINWGKGRSQGGFTATLMVGDNKHRIVPIYSYSTSTKFELPFNEFKAPFNAGSQLQAELIDRLSCIDGIQFSADPKRPAFDCKLLTVQSKYDQFVGVIKWMVAEISRYERVC